MRTTRRAALAHAAAIAAITPARAQDRPVRFIVPYPPGGPTDLVGRIAAAALAPPAIVDNRAGGGGSIGAGEVARVEIALPTTCSACGETTRLRLDVEQAARAVRLHLDRGAVDREGEAHDSPSGAGARSGISSPPGGRFSSGGAAGTAPGAGSASSSRWRR